MLFPWLSTPDSQWLTEFFNAYLPLSAVSLQPMEYHGQTHTQWFAINARPQQVRVLKKNVNAAWKVPITRMERVCICTRPLLEKATTSNFLAVQILKRLHTSDVPVVERLTLPAKIKNNISDIYRWVPVDTNPDNPNSRLIRSYFLQKSQSSICNAKWLA